MALWWLLLPLGSAIIGWLIHFLAGRYLLYQYLPGRDQEWAQQAGKMADEYVKNHVNLTEKLAHPDLIEKVMPHIEHHIDDFLNVKLAAEIPMLSMFVGNKTTDKIREVFIQQLRILFPQVMLQLATDAQNNFKIGTTLEQKLQETPISSLIKNKLPSQIRQLRCLGFLSGFIIGLVNLVLLYLISK